MAKNKTVRVTEEELALIKALREKGTVAEATETAEQTKVEAKTEQPITASQAQQALADAFVSAIERTRPPEKKTAATYKPTTPWSPPKGVPQAKLKRRMYQHGIIIEGKVSNDEIELLNKVRPGVYCDGFIRVNIRKDRGLDIDYPVKTASQRLRLINQYGIRSFSELLNRLIDENANPTKYRRPDDIDIYE